MLLHAIFNDSARTHKLSIGYVLGFLWLVYMYSCLSRFPVLESVSDSPLSPFNVQPNQTTPHQQNDAAVLRQPSPCGASYRLPPLPSVFASVTVLPGVPANPCTTLMHPRLLQYRFGQEQLPQMPPPPGNTNGDPHTTTNQAGAAAANRRDLGAMEGRQIRLAISLILASRSAVYRIDHFMRVCDRHIHASMSLLSISKEVSLICLSFILECGNPPPTPRILKSKGRVGVAPKCFSNHPEFVKLTNVNCDISRQSVMHGQLRKLNMCDFTRGHHVKPSS